MLELKGLNVSYGKLQVLWDISIKINKGEIVALIGANGAGKTTLLSTVAGILKPSSGEILFKGKRIDCLPPHKIVNMGISLVPEDRKLFTDLTVRENLLMGAYSSRIHNRSTIEDALKTVYQLFPVLKERNNQLSTTLSGGEQRMLAIARGLMSNPDLLLLDEPSQGLSPKLTIEIFKTLEKLKSNKLSILLAEQNIYRALKCADRAYVVETGRITLEGKGTELLGHEHIKEAFLGL